MYQQFRGQVIAALSDMSASDLNRVCMALDKVGQYYEFSKKTTEIAVYCDGLPEAAKVYLVTKKIEGLSEKTLLLYKLYLEKFFGVVTKPLDKIEPNDIRLFLYTYQEQRKISNRTLDSMRTVIQSFFGWCAAESYIKSDPSRNIKPIRYEVKQRVALTQMELETVRHACRTPREKAIVEFLFSTGCRVSEAIGAKISDIDWDRAELTVLGKGNKHRVVYLNAKAILALKEYFLSRSDQTDAIFVQSRNPHGRVTKSAVEAEINRIGARCNLGKPLTPHIFRHTMATAGIQSIPVQDVSRMLGHASISTTMIYAEVSDEKVKSEHKKYIV